MKNDKEKVKSPCGAADLVAAILGLDPDTVRAKFDLPLRYPQRPPCPICGGQVRLDGKCHTPHYIWVACTCCGKLIKRSEKDVLWKCNQSTPLQPRGAQHFFCNRSCYGKWFGTKNKKYDYDAVWQKHLETGYGAWRLGKLLNIPYSSVTLILRKRRKQNGIRIRRTERQRC